MAQSEAGTENLHKTQPAASSRRTAQHACFLCSLLFFTVQERPRLLSPEHRASDHPPPCAQVSRCRGTGSCPPTPTPRERPAPRASAGGEGQVSPGRGPHLLAQTSKVKGRCPLTHDPHRLSLHEIQPSSALYVLVTSETQRAQKTGSFFPPSEADSSGRTRKLVMTLVAHLA